MMGDLTEGLTGTSTGPSRRRCTSLRPRASFQSTLANPLLDDPRIHHVRYPDFVADPVGTIRGFYAFAGVP